MPITTYLKKSRVALTLILGALLGTAQADDKPIYKLTLAETWGANTPILGDAPKNMAKLAAEMSNGRIQIRIDSANKHKAPLGVFDMVKSGQYDLGHSSSYYWKGKVPNTLFLFDAIWDDCHRAVRLVLLWWWHAVDGESVRATQSALLPWRKLRYSNGRLV